MIIRTAEAIDVEKFNDGVSTRCYAAGEWSGRWIMTYAQAQHLRDYLVEVQLGTGTDAGMGGISMEMLDDDLIMVGKSITIVPKTLRMLLRRELSRALS